MGLIKAGIGALGGTLADQWKEFFYCESMPKEVLVTKGQKRVSGRSSNTKGSDNIISNGSGIAVADGQCMIIVEPVSYTHLDVYKRQGAGGLYQRRLHCGWECSLHHRGQAGLLGT